MNNRTEAAKEKAKLGIINFLVMANDISYGEAEDIVGETQTRINGCSSHTDCAKVIENYLGIKGDYYLWIFL